MKKEFLTIPILLTCMFSRYGHGNGLEELAGRITPSMKGSEEAYEEMRSLRLDSTRIYKVDSLSMHKDVGEFLLESGFLYLLKPTGDKTLAAYFEGKGVFSLSTDDRIERQQIERFTGKSNVEQAFEKAFFIFTDNTFSPTISSKEVAPPSTYRTADKTYLELRKTIRRRFIGNDDARALGDLLTAKPGHFFRTYLECPGNEHLVFAIDPLEGEEVSLIRYKKSQGSDRADCEVWFSSHASDFACKYKYPFDIKIVDADVSIDSKKVLKATARILFMNLINGTRIIPVTLAPKLKVEAVTTGDNDTCLFFQEKEEEDSQLWVVLPAPLRNDSIYEVIFSLSGEGIIKDVGGSNFVVGERYSWLPRFYSESTDPARFILRFRVPKKMTLLSTGNLRRTWQDGQFSCSEWDTDLNFTVAGFNYGEFSKTTQTSQSCEIDCYTNTSLCNELQELKQELEENAELMRATMTLPQALTADGVGLNAAVESRNAFETCVRFFGRIPVSRITVSQQPQMNFGQSWPSLIYLPYTAFFSESLKDRLGLTSTAESELWCETLAAHEIAHQWWGHTVIVDSYRDEWLSEGFATYSAALYIQATAGSKCFKDYMGSLQERILKKVEKGRRATQLGPICLGARLNSIDDDHLYLLIYTKGSFVLHMLRMMLFDYSRKTDDRFISMMKEYVSASSGRSTGTEDFKRIVDKHFGEDMNWFFDQWVYGTEVPIYKSSHTVTRTDEGKYVLSITVEQQGVSPSFKMPVPVLISFKEGHAVVRMPVIGSQPVTKQYTFEDEPKAIELNPLFAVLCEIK